MPDQHYDVVIGGAGPAGSSAAIVLSQAGLRVCLVDGVDDRALKVGESLPGAAIRLLRRLGIAGLDQLLPSDAYHACVANVSAWGSDHWSYQDAIYRPEGGGWHLVRHQFDAALRRHAVAQGVHRVSAQVGDITIVDQTDSKSAYQISLKRCGDHVPPALQASWVVDATGRSHAVARQFSATRQRLDDQMAVIARLRGDDCDADLTTRIKSVADGWWYTARLPDGTRVVVFHALPVRIAQLVKAPGLFLQALNETDLLPQQSSERALLNDLAATHAGVSRLEPAFGRGWLAVGDAALAHDPLSSQGIFFALYSGVRSGETILTVHRDQQPLASACEYYQSLIDRVFEANQQARRHYYGSELRFLSEPYWQQRLGSNAPSAQTRRHGSTADSS